MHKLRQNSIRITALLLLLIQLLLLAGCAAPAPEARESIPVPATPQPELPPPAQLRVSEYMAKNRATVLDGYRIFSDWLELENYSGQDLSLSGWSLSDNREKTGCTLPEITVPAGGRLLIFASGKESTGHELHVDFSLSEGEDICLFDQYGRLIDLVEGISAEADCAYVRSPEGAFAPTDYPTPGYENSAEGYELWQQSRSCDSPLVIYEAMNANSAYLRQNDYSYHDWVDIKNVSSEELLLSDYYLSDDSDDMLQWQFPGFYLAPGESITVMCSGESYAGSNKTTYASFSLNSEREQLYLSSRDRLLDYVSLGQLPHNTSFGRMDGENGFYHFAEPSPRRTNLKGCRTVSQKPTSSTKDGVYENVDSVSVELSGVGEIHYTTDGSLPSAASPLYTGPLMLTETTVLRSVCVNEGMLNSPALTQSFIINEGHTLPVISLVANDPSGFEHIYHSSYKTTVPGCVSLYESDGSFTIDCGLKLSGATSLNLGKKNISVKFRARFGQSTLNYDVFDGGISEFTDLTIRAGQDHYNAMIRNELCQELCLDTSDAVLTQRSKFCVLYLNGKYWGIYAIKDKINEQFYASLAGVSEESVTLVDAPAAFGSSFYDEVLRLCVNNDMRLAENYEKLCSVLDIDSLIDWLIMEGVSGNSDIFSGNLRYVRSSENDGKWRLIYYDLDCGFYHAQLNFYNVLERGGQRIPQFYQIVSPLLKNEDFRQRFLERFSAAIKGPLSNEAILAKIDLLQQTISPEMPRNETRWSLLSVTSWERYVNRIRSMITDYDWQQYSIDNVCDIFGLTEAEIAEYFG